MKKILMTFLVLALSHLTFAAGPLSVDTAKSKIDWKGTKVTGQHVGTLKFKSGTISLDDKGVLKGAEFVVDMNSINVTDLSGEWKAKLEAHLKNDDFFSVNKHKEAKLKLTKVKTKKGDTYDVMANLTIKGKSQPVSFKVTLGKGGKTAKGKVKFDRTKYGIKYGSGSFFKGLGDKMIHDDVEFNFNIVSK